MQDDTLAPKELFGGAIRLWLPARFADVSDYRPVPDHQEVCRSNVLFYFVFSSAVFYAEVFADGSCDQSLIVEALEYQRQVADQDAAAFYLQDAAGGEEEAAGSLQIIAVKPVLRDQVPSLNPPREASGAPPTVVGGAARLRTAKGRQSADKANLVQVLLAVVRIPSRGSDLVFSLYSPIEINPGSAAAEQVGPGQRSEHERAPGLFADILRTLTVKDYGFFGESS